MPRIDLAGLTQHLVQRGVNRCVCFADRLDREFYLASLDDAAHRFGCSIHAYALMTNHVHLLVTPEESGCLSRMMQCLGRNYVRRFNNRFQRTGTLWEGRYKSSPVETERYLLQCYRYIDLNPVRAAIVESAWEYEWSSAQANGLGVANSLLNPHPEYLRLGRDEKARGAAYRELLVDGISSDELANIREHLKQGKVLGASKFQSDIGVLVGRQVHVRPPGRPPRE